MDKFFETLKADPDLRAEFGAKLHSVDSEVIKLTEQFNEKRNNLILESMSEFAHTHGYELSPSDVKEAYLSVCRDIHADTNSFYKAFFMDNFGDKF